MTFTMMLNSKYDIHNSEWALSWIRINALAESQKVLIPTSPSLQGSVLIFSGAISNELSITQNLQHSPM